MIDVNQLPVDHEEENDLDLLTIMKDHTNGAKTSSAGLVERVKLQPSGEVF